MKNPLRFGKKVPYDSLQSEVMAKVKSRLAAKIVTGEDGALTVAFKGNGEFYGLVLPPAAICNGLEIEKRITDLVRLTQQNVEAEAKKVFDEVIREMRA